jgi:hypothetical protein
MLGLMWLLFSGKKGIYRHLAFSACFAFASAMIYCLCLNVAMVSVLRLLYWFRFHY